MNEKMFELMQSRGELLARLAAQREQMTEIGCIGRPRWHWPTKEWLPCVFCVAILCWSPVVLAFSVIRHRGAAGLVSGVWGMWKGYRYFTFGNL